MPEASPAATATDPQAPLGHLYRLGFALVGASGIDEIAASVLTDLAALPGVRRLGFALSEGGGRRLRFTSSDRHTGDGVAWCHIDAYDDVPLTEVMRTGRPVFAARADLAPRFEEFLDAQPVEVKALAALPLPGVGSPVGGLVVFLEEEWAFDDTQRRLLEAAARRTAEAVRRVRATGTDYPEDAPDPDEGAAATARTLLDDDPRAPGIARRFLRAFLAEAEVSDDLVATAELCLSELVTNAVVHAGTRSELRVTLDTTLTVSVRDRGAPVRGAVSGVDPDALRVHGRGLQLVEALADRWGSERDGAGTTVWFALALDSAHEGASRTG